MNRGLKIAASILVLLLSAEGNAQIFSPSPYCSGGYNSGNCLQGGPTNNPTNSVNDFIHNFITFGGNTNISNTNSGCNGGPNNFAFYCSHYMAVNPGQVITCSVQSGVTYAQGFAIWIDWNQDNTFQNPGEQVAATSNVPAAAQWTTLAFQVPVNQASGVYRLRVRCAFATPGTAITPCGAFSHGETEDYNIFVGQIPNNTGPVSGTTAVMPGTIVCAGTTVNLQVNTNYSSGVTFSWTGPGNFTSAVQNPVLASAQPTASGIYTVVSTNSFCPSTNTIEIKVVGYPQINLTPSSPTICNNGVFFSNCVHPVGVNPFNYAYLWSPSTGAGFIFSKFAPGTSITPLPLPPTQSVGIVHYSVTVTPTVYNCPVTKVVTVTINNPLGPTLTVSPPLCNNSPQFQFSAIPVGGFWSGNSGVAAGGLLTPSLAAIGTNTVKYTAVLGNCSASSIDSFSISRYHTPALTASLSSVCVHDPYHNLMNLVQDTVTGVWNGPSVSFNRYFSPSGLATGIYTFTYNTWSTPISSVCPASTVFAVPVFNPPVPVISAILPRCNNAATTQLVASPPGGSWSGNGAVSSSGILTPSLAIIGTNPVTYVSGQGTCVASASRTFHVSQFNTAAFSGSISELCATNKPVSLHSVVQNTNGTWSGINVMNNYFNPYSLPTNNYTLTYHIASAPDSLLCPDQNHLVVAVLNPPVPTLSSVGPFCSKQGTIQLNASPATGHWVSSHFLSADGIFTASLAPVGDNMVQYVVGTPTCFVAGKTTISIEVFVPSKLITDRLPDLCNTSAPLNLLPYSVASSGSWGGPALQGYLFNPALAGSGEFVLTYSTSTIPSGLCPDRSTLAVNIYSLAPPIVSEIPPVCSNAAPFQLAVSPVGGMFEGVNTGAIDHAGLFRPSDAQIGLNVVTYSISAGPCVAYTQSTINIEKFIPATLHSGDGLSFCRSDPPFNLNSIAVNPGFTWSGEAVKPDGMFDPAKAGTGDIEIRYRTHSLNYGQLCPDQSSLIIRVDAVPVIKPVSSVYKACTPFSAELSLEGTTQGKAQWKIGDGPASMTDLSATHLFSRPGNYSVTVNYTLGACKTNSTLPFQIQALESPVADFDFSRPELLMSDPVVELENKSTVQGNNSYVWSIRELGELYDINPQVTFPRAGLYNVTLKATSYDGCTDELTRTIEVRNDFHVFVPNSFTPNYDDLNDQFIPLFSPYGLDLGNYSLEIFDRWGHLVFHSADYEVGWNGSFRNNGEVLKEGSYVYRIRYRDIEGKAYVKNGTVLLLTGQ